MTSLALSSVIYKSCRFMSRITRASAIHRPNLFSAPGRRAIQSSSNQESSLMGEAVNAVKQGVDEVVTSSENIASRGAHTASNLTDKAKQTAESAWGSAKEVAQKAKDKVAGAAQDTKESIRANAAEVERSMNTKN